MKRKSPPNNDEQAWRKQIAKDLPMVLEVLIQAAKNGDVQAAKTLVERAIPAYKPRDQATVFKADSDNLANTARAVMKATSEGALTPEESAKILTSLSHVARAVEITELETRIAKIESEQQHDY